MLIQMLPTMWETTSANKKESMIRWCLSWCPNELKYEKPCTSHFWLTCHYADVSIVLLSASSCVLKWEDPHDSVVYCIDSDKKWMVISGTNRYGVVREICITLRVNSFWSEIFSWMNLDQLLFYLFFYLGLLSKLFSQSLTVSYYWKSVVTVLEVKIY